MASDRPWFGWAAVAVGVCAVVAAFAASSTQVGEGFTFGFGAFIAFFGALAVFARERRPDHWGLVVVGLAMFIVPFLGNGYQADLGASWTCWVAGGLAMILGGIAWSGGKTPSEYGINTIGSGQAMRSAVSFWIGRAALGVGLATVLLGIATHNTTAGTAVTIGLGGLMAVIGVWSLLAVDPTHDFLTLAITGFALFLSPWVAGFVGHMRHGRRGLQVPLPPPLASAVIYVVNASTSPPPSAMTPLSSTARDSGRPVSQLVPGADDGTDSTNRYRRIDARHDNSHPLNTHRDQLSDASCVAAQRLSSPQYESAQPSGQRGLNAVSNAS